MTRSRNKIAAILLTVLVVLPRLWAAQSRAEMDLRAAIEMETVKGDLKAAIDLYSKLAQNTDRAVAAQALVRMGQCYEKLGAAQMQEAQKAYERAIRDFADQKEAVTTARARLDAMGSSGAYSRGESRMRLLLDRPGLAEMYSNVTADGRYILTDMGIRDLQTGQLRKVFENVGNEEKGRPYVSLISPDGKRIAFGWCRLDNKKDYCQLRLIGIDGKGERQLYPVKGWSTDNLEVFSWSPDGNWIAALGQPESGAGGAEILLISTNQAPTRTLPKRSKKGKDRLSFSPDGKWLAYDSASGMSLGKSGIYLLPVDGTAKEEMELVSDANIMGWTPDGSGVLFRRFRNGMNGLYLQPVQQGKATGEAQLLHAALAGDRPIGVTQQGTLLHGSLNLQCDTWITEIDT